MAALLGFGTALPDFRLTPEQGRDVLAAHWPHLTASRIEPVTRYTVLPIDEVFQPRSMSDRMRLYDREAPRLAQRAVEQALRESGKVAAQVDLLISVSCTGYMVPSLDVRLANRMGFRADIVRLPITELGCSGGGAGIAAGYRHLCASPESVVLVVCVELCSLTFSPDDSSLDNLTASLVFGDGAAAVVMAGEGAGMRVTAVGSRLIPDSERFLGFQLRDEGFHPVLDRKLPRLLATELKGLLESFDRGPFSFHAVHAGGPRIFDAVESSLGIPGGALTVSREIFRRYGNVSSASLLFVLAALTKRRGRGLAMAFGPGVSVELLSLKGCGG
ncbi:MAG TPA: type III polyketide synthase [Candidatus Dormibacteraeota bacterium]|nr:type III polyketide synthase [Candidatus Dormibacteraeota bacterium]